jgi:hypothetical protein
MNVSNKCKNTEGPSQNKTCKGFNHFTGFFMLIINDLHIYAKVNVSLRPTRRA